MGKLHSPYRSRASSGLQQRTQPMAFPIYRAKPVALFGQGIQCTVLPHSGHKQQDVKILGPIWLTCQGREANSYPHLWISIIASPNCLGSLIREPRQQQRPSYTASHWKENQASSPILLFLSQEVAQEVASCKTRP